MRGNRSPTTFRTPTRPPAPTKVTWEYAPLSIQYLANACQVGFNFIEVPNPSAAPSYPVNSTCLRFPSTTLQTALLSQVQQIIPLVHIRVREQAVPDIYLSDRRCTVGGQLYLPRVLGLGEPGSDVIISQDIKGTADNVQFTFGNADRAMTALANDTDLKFASIDLSLYHVNTGILLQLWSGFIVGFRLRWLAAIHRARQRRAVPDHADVPRAGHLAAVLEDLQRWRELSRTLRTVTAAIRPPATTTSIPPTAARRTA